MEFASVTWVDYAVIGVYFVFLALVGLLFRGLNENESDFFRAGAKSSWWLVGMSIFMAGISTGTFVGNAGLAYRAGFTIFWDYLISATLFLVLSFGIAAWYRQARVISFPEIIRERFGSGLQQFFSYYVILSMVVFGGVGLLQLALFASSVFGFHVSHVIIAMGTVVVVYTLFGGYWAVLATDFLQGLILLSMAVLLAVLSLREIGGVSGFFETLAASDAAVDFRFTESGNPEVSYGPGWMLGLVVIRILGRLGAEGGQRFFACKDGRHARKAALFASVAMLLGMFIFLIPPMVARLLYSAEINAIPLPNPSDTSYAYMSRRLLPFGMVPLMVVAMFSAQLSTLDTSLNANSGIFIRNAYPALMRLFGRVPREDHRYLLKLGRILTLCFGVALITSALYLSRVDMSIGIYDILLSLVSVILVPQMIPLCLGVLVPRTPKWSGWACFLTALIVSWTFFMLNRQEGVSIPVYVSLLSTSGAGILVFFLSRLAYARCPESEKADLEALATRIRTPVDFESEVGSANDHQQLLMIGTISTSLGMLLLFFLLFPNDWDARAQILTIALSVSGVGAFMLLLARRMKKKENHLLY